MTTDALEQRIRVLPESVINQIAAGEVVLRPASVVKELGENAIDAGAFHISFWTERGGKDLIQVSDDGVGMSPIDAELCFERHATSKISSAKDLYHLLTKGFRGEALASIAAVADVHLFTRRHQDMLGTHVHMAFGKKLLVEPYRCAAGTTLTVQKLFYRLPVRRKSLRSDVTEHRHNLQEFFRLAYPHPDRHFRYHHNGVLLFDLPATSLRERILALHPEVQPEDLVPVDETTPFFQVQGFLVLPEATPTQNKDGFLFINQRYIRHAGLQQALMQVYKPFFRGEQRPLYWLFLTIDPSQVDVNVTPSKTEVRLLKEMEIRAMLYSIVRKAVALGRLTPSIDWIEKSTESISSLPTENSIASSANALVQEPRIVETPLSPTVNECMVLYGRYAVLRKEEEVWLIDISRAYQRILYEQYLREIPVSSQGLLFPVHASVSPEQAAKLAELISDLERVGLRVEIREGKEAVLHSIPVGLAPAIGGVLLEEVIRLAGEDLPADWRPRIALNMARYGAPRPPYKLSAEAVDALWNDLMACTDSMRTPTGKPIRFLLTEGLLERLFG
ncbi:MAG: DNA mismatch repair endonuclease MutL [Bacteroidia bacterium]|nr:DNA mismatch repair endonuclease MutL [Bacteroidia bacterium]MCX7652224.1 DNA mismatch repair endonuclease MutL [Bacteroidia bacterium]MDW8416486.1 DNA mismatch repair endonuclease MutL [Bacteroidia bacterium]